MTAPETFATERLVLRRPVLDDAPAIFHGYARDPEVLRYLGFRPHETIQTTYDFLHRAHQDWEASRDYAWAMTFRDVDQCVGMISLRPRGWMAEIGYVLARPHWGQGLVPEAALALVEWALAQPTIYRVWAVCDVENPASARVMEKVGMAREGILRRWIIHPQASDEPRDCVCYARVR